MGLDIFLCKPKTVANPVYKVDGGYGECIDINDLDLDSQSKIFRTFGAYITLVEKPVIDFEKFFKKRDLNFSDYTIICEYNNQILFAHKSNPHVAVFRVNKYKKSMPMKTKLVPVIFYDVIMDQRRGENSAFWDSDHNIVVSETEALEHSEKYFQGSEFDSRILGKFVEGRHFILYD